ncbi:MAG: type VI secretion system tube protein Hcp [Succinivibrionaceae bacterium]
MSNVIMRIVDVKVAGSASLTGVLNPDKLAADGLKAEGEWFNVETIEWSAEKKESGLNKLAPITITRKLDGASDKLLSFFFSPGEEGQKVEIAFTKEASTGVGVVKYYEIKLSNVRMCTYDVEANEEETPTETFSLAYSEITQSFAVDDNGAMNSSGEVTFNLATSALTSGIEDSLK